MKKKLLIITLFVTSLGVAQEYFGSTTYGDAGIDASYQSTMNTNGTIYTPGLFQSTLTIGANTITSAGGNADGYLAIHDSDGTPQGVLQFGGGFDDVVVDVVTDADNNIYLTGYFQGANPNAPFDANPGPGVFPLLQPAFGLSRDLFVIKLNSNQEFVWAKQVSNPFGFGAINEDAQAIDIDSDGNIYIGGSFVFADFDPDPAVENTIFSADSSTPDGFLLKLDNDGNFVWVKTYEGAGGIVEVEDIQINADEDIIITGRFRNQVDLDPGTAVDNYTTNGSDDIFVSKVDTDGNYIWGQVFGGAGLDFVNSIIEIESHIFITGTFAGTVDLDPSAGDNTVTSNGNFDGFLSQFDTDGNYIGTYITGGEDDSDIEDIFAVVEGPNGDLFVSGSFGGTSDFDASGNTATSTSNGINDNFYVQLKPDFSYVNHWTVGGSETENNPFVLFNAMGEIVTTGMFRGSVDLDPFDGEDIQTTVAQIDVYVSNYFPFSIGNDSCNGAIALACGDTVSGETIFDTDSGGNPAPDEFFSYTGTGSLELVTLSLCNGTDFDSVLRVYDDCDLANEIAMNNDSCGTQSELQFVSDGTSTYYIMVEGNDMASGNFNLEVSCQELPENDFCDGALPISCGETIMGSTDDATIDSSPVCDTDITAPGVWYIFEDTSGLVTDYTLSLCDDTSYDSKITVYTGECGNLVCEIDNDDACGLQSEVSFQGDGNTTYYILVHGFGSSSGDFSLNLDCVPVPPVNDMIANSIDVDEIGVPFTDEAVPMPGATTEAGTPEGCNNAGVRGVWYHFTATADGEASAIVENPVGFTSVTFYTAPDENATETDLTLVDYSDNQCVPGDTASIPTVSGQTYYVYVANTGAITDITIEGSGILGTNDFDTNTFAMYPNPANSEVNLDAGKNAVIESVTVFSILGQEVLNSIPNETKTTLNVSGLSRGSYLIKAVVNGQTVVQKLLKQ